jgi:alpha-amylase/alpha-mannosidase (GH57 family)
MTNNLSAVIFHGHFYQPPRENPRTGEVEQEISAAPYHDWNERIHAECYGPNAAAAVGEHIVNNYAKISFNFGPTLLSWMEKHHPETYQRIIAADKESFTVRSGHGNAIAQAYGHAILPLCNDHDRLTQIVWGMVDFRHRFGREPESMWLPETACDDATLDVLIAQGLRFVILAPAQASRYRALGDDEWHDVADSSIDGSRAYVYFHRDGSGRSIAIFFYNGPLARAIAFEKALTSSERLVRMIKSASAEKQMINIAIDGETYGHHFKFGDLSLAHVLEVEGPREGFWITNYGEFLDRFPPQHEVEVKAGPHGEGTACSCAHGVSRWIRNCGCHTGGESGWNQEWRGPLRSALNYLRDRAAEGFEEFGSELFMDPWQARNAYIDVLLKRCSPVDFLLKHARRARTPVDAICALKLLEMQRNALLMFTSCGWFFYDVSGIETIQVMKYAARVIELSDQLGLPSHRQTFLQMLGEAKSNLVEKGTGADIYLRDAEPSDSWPTSKRRWSDNSCLSA